MYIFSFGLIFFIPIISLKIFHKPKIFSQSTLVIWDSAILQQDLLGLLIGGWFLISWKFAIECECIHGASFSCGEGNGAFSNRKMGQSGLI